MVLARARARTGVGPVTTRRSPEALDLAYGTAEAQRVGPLGGAAAEIAWIVGDADAGRAGGDRAPGTWCVSTSTSPWTRGIIATWLPDAEAAAVAESLAPPYRAEALRRWDEAAELWDALGSRYAAGAGPGPRAAPARDWPRPPYASTSWVPRPPRPVRGARRGCRAGRPPADAGPRPRRTPRASPAARPRSPTLLAEGTVQRRHRRSAGPVPADRRAPRLRRHGQARRLLPPLRPRHPRREPTAG